VTAHAEQPEAMGEQERWFRRAENTLCEEFCTREGDRLIKVNDRLGAEVAFRLAAIMRIRRDEKLSPF
jgi:hypothetical protein